MIRRIPFLFALTLLAALSLPAQGAEADEASSPFRLSPVADGAILGVAAGTNVAALCLDKAAKSRGEDFPGGALDPSRVNGFDRAFMSSYSRSLDRVGTGLEIVSALAPAALLAAPGEEWGTIGIMYAETMLTAYGLKNLGKAWVSRARPFMYYDDYPRDAAEDGDWDRSFPSGHCAVAFAGASFASYAFCRYFPDSSLKIPVVASSYALAIGTAACRVASGNHFMTDVMVGAAIGTACGIVVPWLHETRAENKRRSTGKGESLSIVALPMGLLFTAEY